MQGGKPLTINHADVSTCNSWVDFEIHYRNISRLYSNTDIEINRNLSTLSIWKDNRH